MPKDIRVSNEELDFLADAYLSHQARFRTWTFEMFVRAWMVGKVKFI